MPEFDRVNESTQHQAQRLPRYCVQYESIEIPCDADYAPALQNLWSGDGAKRLACRKKLWRRWRTGYYDRHEPCPPTRWDNKGNRIIPPGERCRCRARCRSGQPCKLLAVTNKYTGKLATRCRLHGGHSTGPRTEAGKAAALAALARYRGRNQLGAEMSG